jgi:hypothetical protein
MSAEFWEKLLLAVVGPLVGAIVGTLIIGLFVAWITRKAQERRADSLLQEERTRAENQLRFQLIRQMTEAASALYMATQHFWRKKDVENTADSELAEQRKELDQHYRACRIQGEVIERQLEAYFLTADAKALWHATMDLLTVRYFHLVGLTTENLLQTNSGKDHTGLSVEQLRDQGLILKTYRQKLTDSAQVVLKERIRPLAN